MTSRGPGHQQRIGDINHQHSSTFIDEPRLQEQLARCPLMQQQQTREQMRSTQTVQQSIASPQQQQLPQSPVIQQPAAITRTSCLVAKSGALSILVPSPQTVPQPPTQPANIQTQQATEGMPKIPALDTSTSRKLFYTFYLT